jgi:hypothetical protein
MRETFLIPEDIAYQRTIIPSTASLRNPLGIVQEARYDGQRMYWLKL